MTIQILMPALSPTMTEGKLAKWLKKEGDKIASGDVLAEIETDKATMEVEAVDEGVLQKILVQEGTENVAVNTPIAVLGDGADGHASNGNGAQGAKPSAATASAAPATAPAPAARAPEPPKPAAAPKPAPAPVAAEMATGNTRKQ